MREITRKHLLQCLHTQLERWGEFAISLDDLAYYMCFATSCGYYVPKAISRAIDELTRENLIQSFKLDDGFYYFYK